MPYKPEDLAYIAGLIDGEGYIGLVKYIEKRRTKETYYYHPSVKISMCSRIGIDFATNLFIGNIWFHDKSQYGNWQDQFEWAVSGQKRVKQILIAILPFLKIKKEQAILLLKFIKHRESLNTHKIKWGKSSYTEKEDEIYKKMRELNKRGRR